MRRRVFITGVGAVSPLGIGVQALWDGLCAGRTGLGAPSLFDASGFASKLGGQVPGEFSGKDFVPKSYRKAVKVMARDSELAVAAARLATEDGGIVTRGTLDGAPGETTYSNERMGCQIGAGLINAETDELTSALATSTDQAGQFDFRKWGTVDGGGGMNNLQPLWMLKYLPNMLACHVTIIHGCEGPSNTITCAEASSILSVGEGMRVIERDAADICISGGCESKVNLMGWLRWTLLNRLAPVGTQADGGSVIRPFESGSAGTLLGEGGGLLILEEASKAKARGTRVYAELKGFGAAHSPPPAYEAIAHVQKSKFDDRPGDGVRFAVEAALADAGVGPGEIDAIVPGASGIAVADADEAEGLRAVFGERLAEIEMITIAPNVGQTVAGQGALQLAAAAMAMREQRLPARLHGGTAAGGIRAGKWTGGGATLRNILVLSPSLGGQNAAAVLGRAGM
ncbi:MAG: beta-ketoacyl synthase N-terminal-like domain-containing protein [Phycisphaerales bacterium]|nr:hypothetical protein [Planctomycetota bacterium]